MISGQQLTHWFHLCARLSPKCKTSFLILNLESFWNHKPARGSYYEVMRFEPTTRHIFTFPEASKGSWPDSLFRNYWNYLKNYLMNCCCCYCRRNFQTLKNLNWSLMILKMSLIWYWNWYWYCLKNWYWFCRIPCCMILL